MKNLLLITALLVVVACKDKKPEKKFQCAEYVWGVKPFCEDPTRLSEDENIRATQLRICADPEKRKLKKCIRMEEIK